MSVLLRINNVCSVVEGDLPKLITDEIRTVMSYVVPGHKFMPRYKQDQILAKFQGREPWDGTKTVALWKRDTLVFPTGLFSYFKEILAKHGQNYSIRDERLQVIKKSGYSLEGFVARDYQQKIIDDGLNRQRGVMKVSTGGGKTAITTATIVNAGCFPAMFYVTSCDLLEQAYDMFNEYVRYNGTTTKIGRIGGGHFDIQDITISTVQSAEIALSGSFTKNEFDDYNATDKTKLSDTQKSSIRQLIEESQFVYVDECHHVSSQTIQTILNASHKAKFRIGGSASPWRDDGLDLLIEAAFGRRYCDITASFLIQNNWLVRPYITFNHFNQSLSPSGTFAKHYSNYVVHNEARNRWIANRAKFHMDLGRPTIILVKHVPHAELLADLIGENIEILTSSGDPKKSPAKRKEVLERLRERKLMGVIGTSLLDEGVDVPAATTAIFAGGGKSSTRELQRIGRVIRKDPNDPKKDRAYIEEFWDHTKFLSHHAKMRRRILETEVEFEVNDNRDTAIL